MANSGGNMEDTMQGVARATANVAKDVVGGMEGFAKSAAEGASEVSNRAGGPSL